MMADLRLMCSDHFVVLPTFQCTARCAHCQHGCSPERRETMSLDLFLSVIGQALDMNWTTLCLSGGEPFLLPRYVRAAADACRARSRRLVIQTNGFWGRDPKQAQALLKGLNGVLQVGFSVDAVHLREIPLESVLGAMDACLDNGIARLTVSVAHQKAEELDILRQQLTARYPGIEVVGWPIVPVGRAANHKELWAQTPTYPWDTLQHGCGAQVSCSPIVHPNGDVHLCYRTVMALEQRDPLILGNAAASPLQRLFSSVENRLLLFILAFGGGGMGYLLQDSPYKELLERRYYNVCQFCHEVLSNAGAVRYLDGLLDGGAFDERLGEGLRRLLEPPPPAQPKPCRLLVCNGKNCARHGANYAPIHYLINRLTDSGLIRLVDLQLVECLKACGEGPNFQIEGEAGVLRGMTREKVDELLLRLGRTLSGARAESAASTADHPGGSAEALAAP